METLYLVDISSFIFRAFYAIRHLSSPGGEPTNAVFGVATMMAKLFDAAKPTHICVTFDSKEPSFRELVYADYKANRAAPPEELIPQFARIDELIQSLKIPNVRKAGVEADDLIATLTVQWTAKSPNNRVVIVTGDKDLMQLVNDRVTVWDTMNDKRYGPAEVVEKFQVTPGQIRDYLALIGDSSDHIPGVDGIGPKSAVELIKLYQTLAGVLTAAKDGKIAGKKGITLVEQEKTAQLSYELVTLKSDCELPGVSFLDALNYRFQMTETCTELLKKLGFDSLQKKWNQIYPERDVQERSASDGAQLELMHEESPAVTKSGDTTSVGTTRLVVPEFKTLNTQAALTDLIATIRQMGEFAVDLETTSLNCREAAIVGISICVRRSSRDSQDDQSLDAYYIPLAHRDLMTPQLDYDWAIATLRPILEDANIRKIGQNLKYDFSVLRESQINAQGIAADTMIAAYVIDPEGRHNLSVLAEKYLNYKVLTYEEVCGQGKNQIRFDDVPIEKATKYSAEDAWVAMELWNRLSFELTAKSQGSSAIDSKWSLMRVFSEIDMPLVTVLSDMERAGVCLDTDWLTQISKDFGLELEEIEKKVQEFSLKFSPEPVNLNSPKQLAVLLFDQLGLPVQSKTKTGYSTNAEVLETLSSLHEVPRLLLEYREISKLKGTYVDPLPRMRDRKTGKIHTSFHQTVAATGRLSCTEPNLQNIPIRSRRGRMIRQAFLPSPGNTLLSADYSQIELRLLAHFSDDLDLLDAFRRDQDVHKRTAAEIFGATLEEVSDEQRSLAKAINFGLMYGKTAFGLAEELHISRKQAKEMIDRYFERYRGVKNFLDASIEKAKELGYSETLFGRRRTLQDINSKNHLLRAMAERMAMNSPIQGTAADLVKIAMIELAEKLKADQLKSQMIIQVHDEIVLDCVHGELEAVKSLVTSVMENAAKLKVPLKVNLGWGDNWNAM